MRFLPLLALIFGFASWPSMMAWMHIPALRTTLWPSWILALAAIAFAVVSYIKLRPLGKLRLVGATLGLLFGALWILNFNTGLQVPRDSTRPQIGDTLPPLALKDESGAAVPLPNGKPALLVFFRGFW